jgi:hypothetical protein
MGLLAEMFVDITGRRGKLDSTLAGVKGSLLGVASSAGRIGVGLMAGLGMGAGIGGVMAIGLGLGKAVDGASHLAESLSKVDAIFGASSGIVKGQADDLAARFGLVKKEVLDTNSSLAGLGSGLGGMRGDKLAGFTSQFTQLAADMSSFHDISMEDAATRLAGGLRGELEPLSKFGILLSADAVEAKALAMGLVKSSKEMTTSAKFAARMQLALEGTKDAQGDLERTAGGFANQSRKLWGGIQNALADFGTAISPISLTFIRGLNGMAASVGAFVKTHSPQITAFANAFVDFASYVGWAAGEVWAAISDMGGRMGAELAQWTADAGYVGGAWEWLSATASTIFETIGLVFRNWSSIVGITGIRIHEFVLNVASYLGWMVSAAAKYAGWFGENFTNLFADAFDAVMRFNENFALNFMNAFVALWDWLARKGKGGFNFTWTPLLDGFKATVGQLPDIGKAAMVDLSGDVRAIEDKMFDEAMERQKRLAAAKAGETKKAEAAAGKKAEAAAGGDAKKSATKSSTSSLEDFRNKLQESITGGKEAARTADATEKTANEAARFNATIDRVFKDADKRAAPAVAG